MAKLLCKANLVCRVLARIYNNARLTALWIAAVSLLRLNIKLSI